MKILTDTGLMVLWNKIKQLVLGNRPYNPSEFSGKGYKVLEKNIQTVGGVKKNILTAIMLSEANTIYEIRYDFDLGGETISIPDGCTLKFEGGSLANGTLDFDDGKIKSDSSHIFKNIKLYNYKGFVQLKWFGAKGDGVIDDTICVKEAFACNAQNLYINEGTYLLSSTIETCNIINIIGETENEVPCSKFVSIHNGIALNVNRFDYLPYTVIKNISLETNSETYVKGSIGIDNSSSQCIKVNNVQVKGFEKLFHSGDNSFYNSFINCRLICCKNVFSNFTANGLKIIKNRILNFESLIYDASYDGPISIINNYIEEIKGSVIVSNSYKPQLIFCYNYVEDYAESVTTNNLIIGKFSSIVSVGNNLQCNGLFRLYYLLDCNSFVSVCNDIFYNSRGSNLDAVYSFSGKENNVLCNDTVKKYESDSNFNREYSGTKTFYNTSNPLANFVATDPVLDLPIINVTKTLSRPTKLADAASGFMFYDTDKCKAMFWNKTASSEGWFDAFGNFADAKNKGTSEERPTKVQIGFIYKDTTINKLIVWDGSSWVNMDGTAIS